MPETIKADAPRSSARRRAWLLLAASFITFSVSAAIMQSYRYDDDRHRDMADVLLDLVDAGEAMQVRADPAQLIAIRAVAKLPRAA